MGTDFSVNTAATDTDKYSKVSRGPSRRGAMAICAMFVFWNLPLGKEENSTLELNEVEQWAAKSDSSMQDIHHFAKDSLVLGIELGILPLRHFSKKIGAVPHDCWEVRNALPVRFKLVVETRTSKRTDIRKCGTKTASNTYNGNGVKVLQGLNFSLS